jgi:TolA-binding protein
VNRTRTLWLAGLLSLALLAPPVFPQRQLSERELLTDLSVDVLNLRESIKLLQGSVTAADAKNDAVVKLVEQVIDRFAPLNASIQKLNDTLAASRTDHDRNSREVADLRKLVEALRGDMKGLNETLAGVNNQVRTVSENLTAMKTAETPLPTAGAIFMQAYSDYSANIHSVAISEFKDFLQQFPRDSRAPSALFYVGRSYTALKEYQMAIDAYDELLQKYPGSDRSCSALYEKGQILGVQKKIPEARAALQQAVKDCPAGTAEAATAAAALTALPLK